ncbi:MAG: hypothetical protein J5925_02460 [Clostridia bacterium]|nr:hypothetical protein [Clostridia bacterium]
MNVDRGSIDRILALDDETLRNLAQSIALASGAQGRKTQKLVNDVRSLRETLARLTPRDAQRLIDAAGVEKSGEIARLLRERGVDIG